MKYKPMTEQDKEFGHLLLIILGPFWLLTMLLSMLYWN
jgi:hypothetical protein